MTTFTNSEAWLCRVESIEKAVTFALAYSATSKTLQDMALEVRYWLDHSVTIRDYFSEIERWISGEGPEPVPLGKRVPRGFDLIYERGATS